MSIPENPNTIVIQNSYYPKGLTEGQVWVYYQKNKSDIIQEINKRPVLMFIFIDINKWIIKRKLYNNIYTLHNNNYDKMISGRTVSISIEQKKITDNWIIDIDPGSSVSESTLKECIENIKNSTISKLSDIKGIRIISTAKGYHFYFLLKKKFDINTSRKILFKLLSSEFSGKYLINKKNPSGFEINLDLTPTTFRGSHTVPGALTRNGLIAMDCTKFWESFNRKQAII